MGRALQPAPAGIPAAFSYERRRPEETTLYQVVQEQIETFLAQVEAKTGAGLPAFVKDEFEAFLECGILAHGFLRVRCAGFSLHAGVRCGAHQRKELERLCRYITRPAIANERLKRNGEGQVVLQLKSAWRDGTTHIKMSPLEFMQHLAALVPRPRLHLIRFHGVLAPNARLRAAIVPGPPEREPADEDAHGRAAALTGAAAGAVPGGLILKVTTVLQWA